MKRSIVIAGLAVATAGRAHAQAAQPEEIVVLGRQIEQNLPQQLAAFGVKMDTLSRADVVNGAYVDVTQVLEAKTPGLFMLPKNGPFDSPTSRCSARGPTTCSGSSTACESITVSTRERRRSTRFRARWSSGSSQCKAARLCSMARPRRPAR